jgi:hypothetical protein
VLVRGATIVLVLSVVSGCGDDATAPIGADMSATVDLSGGPKYCGADGVMSSCASVSGSVDCYFCDFARGGGVCARPCSLIAPSCPGGMQCREFGADGGVPNYAVEGSGCAGYGFCRQ